MASSRRRPSSTSLQETQDLLEEARSATQPLTQQSLSIENSINPTNFVRAWFTNRGLSKVVKSTRSVDPTTPDVNTLLNVANILSDLQVLPTEPTSFKSIPEFVGIDYVGYIVEKERLDKATGRWLRIDEYKIIGCDASNFKDSRVAYGNVYRYRIRSVIKVTTKVIKKSFEALEFSENTKKREKDEIRTQFESIKNVLAGVDRISNLGLKSKISSGKPSDIFEIVKGLSVEVDERKSSVVRLENVSKDKIRDARRLKNLQVENIEFMRGTSSLKQLQTMIDRFLRRFGEEIFDYVSVYYEGEPSKIWKYVSITEGIPPPPPESISIIPKSAEKKILISWLKPTNPQGRGILYDETSGNRVRDAEEIKIMKLYRRNKVGQSWKLIDTDRVRRGINRSDRETGSNYYEDTDVEFGETYIYALSSVDAHDLEGLLSTQIQAELNPDFKTQKREKPLKWISGSGTDRNERNVVLRKFFDQIEPIVAQNSITISPTKDFNELNKTIIIKATSLDTHEQREFKVVLRNKNVEKIEN